MSLLNVLHAAGRESWMDHPGEAQGLLLESIVRKNENTLFGREYLFREIKNGEDFRMCVPLSTYSDLKPYMQLMMYGEDHALVAEPVKAWIQTGGVSDRAKLFPYTDSVAATFREAFLKLFATQVRDWKYVDGKVLCGLERCTVNGGTPVGSVFSLGSGTLKKTPILGKVVTPSSDGSEADWEKWWTATAKQVSRQNVMAAMADPVLLLMFLRKMVREGYNISQLWPNFSLIISNSNVIPYKAAFQSLMGDIEFREIFCTDDMAVAVQRDEKGFIPLYDQVFFEFVSVKEWKDMEEDGGIYREYEFDIKTADTVKRGEEYILVITTSGGVYRYIPGDIFRVVDNLHIVCSGYLEDWEAGIVQDAGQQLVLLREIARNGPMEEHQVVAVESAPLSHLFRL